MKPVVSSIVALCLAIAPMSAMAKPAHKTPHAKVIKHKVEKGDKADKAASDKADAPMVRVKAGKKDGASLKPVVHHAHNVDLGGGGHKEPKVDRGGAIIQASMKTSSASAHAHPHKGAAGAAGAASASAKNTPKASEMPKLPNPNAGKQSKGGAEKGAARKPAEKKNAATDDNAGEPTRDEDFAELVARIRGHHTASLDLPGSAKEPTADSSPDAKLARRVSHTTPKPPCMKEPVEIVRGPEMDRFELTKCDGSLAPLALEHLSILIRPGGAARPVAPLAELAKKPGPELAPGIRRVDPRLVERLQSVVDHFGKAGAPAKLSVISGYRPSSVGSMHSSGRAIDFRVEGAKNEDVVVFCKSLADTGCGFYPNSSFVHLDVRDSGAGHVTWIDASGPGETPRYVSTWPPASIAERSLHRASASEPVNTDLAEEGANILKGHRPLDRESTPETIDDHPAEVAQ